MARSRNRQSTTHRQRDFTTQSLDSLLSIKIRPAPVLIPLPHPTPTVVRETGDRRLFRPDASTASPHAVTRAAARVEAKRGLDAHRLRFADPRLVAICARRTIRREVLFAMKRTRKGSSSPKRSNFWSPISCSRR